MNDKAKIKMLEARNQNLQDTVNQLMKPPEIARVHMLRIPFEEAQKGFDYPSNLKHIWVDYRDCSVFMILPVKKADSVKKPETKPTG